ncbi:MAG: tRNA (5-methylaminomethyl-2-thiouridine)(34)-methyltransferase MnmD [Kordiimonadaceae bacterium]|nr:tRNA (5-methylaminomethyl-2-thiouridine)(34)-methyltransferase MnmD [Kordiimonadaceae bacterium]
MIRKIEKASLIWRGNVPSSSRFDDIYYSSQGGHEETDYVFLQGVGAPSCWHNKSHFVIAETGFGTGLNFMATCKAWVASKATGTLTYISTEKYPLSDQQLQETHKAFPELADIAQGLRAAWPPATPGFHLRSFLGGKVKLLLLFGDATDCFADLDAKVDAWFFDGFSPAKNPDLWSDALFDQIARLSNPGARFATYTAASHVRDALEARGFLVEKVAGFGRKRRRFIGQLKEKETVTGTPPPIPEWAAPPTAPRAPSTGDTSHSTIIIGAGIAGASLAHMLHARGQQPLVITNGSPAASDVPAAILAPGFQRGVQPSAIFAEICFAHACWNPAYRTAWAKEKGLHLTSDDPTEQQRLYAIADKLDWDESWLAKNEAAGSTGLFFPRSGSLAPQVALSNLMEDIEAAHGEISNISRVASGWRVTVGCKSYTAENLVIAAAMNSDIFLNSGLNLGGFLELRAKPGQIEIVAGDTAALPSGSMAYGGYVTAQTQGVSGATIRTIGSTFDVKPKAGNKWPSPKPENSVENLATLEKAMGAAPNITEITASWAGMRATTPDYMPYVGPVPDWDAAKHQYRHLAKDRKYRGLGTMPYQQGLYLLTGFGSKGFQQAPLCAAYTAALICQEPLPLPLSLVPYLHPARHMIKSIVRQDAE